VLPGYHVHDRLAGKGKLQVEEDGQEEIDRTRQPGPDSQNRSFRTGKIQDRTARTKGMPVQDMNGKSGSIL
jgi:hypothetical protein